MRNAAATVVGWLLVAVIVYLLFGFVVGTLRWLVRFVVIIAVVIGLGWAYFRLKAED